MFVVIILIWQVHFSRRFLLGNPCALLSLFHIKRHLVRVLLNIFFKPAQRLKSSARSYLFRRCCNFGVRHFLYILAYSVVLFQSFFPRRDISLNVDHSVIYFKIRRLFFLTQNASILLVGSLALHHDYFWLDPLVFGSLKFGSSVRWLLVDRNYKFIFVGYIEISGSCLLSIVELLVLIQYVVDFVQIRILAFYHNASTHLFLNWSAPFIFNNWLGSSSWCLLEGLIHFYGILSFQSLIKVWKLVNKILFFGILLLLKMYRLLSERCQLLPRNS